MTSCYIVKVGIVGDFNVGKSSFLNSYIEQETFKSHVTTIGVDFRYMFYKYRDTDFKLQIWDTAGQEQYANIVRSYLKEIDIAIFMYDITNRETFNNLDRWIKEIDYFNMDKNVIKYIVGNKKDLNKHREVELYQLKKFCKNKNINYSESSIQDINSLNEIFENIIEELYFNLINKKIELKSFYKLQEQLPEKKKDKNKCCNYL